MYIAVSSYSFNKLLVQGTMRQIDCVKAAKELGFDAIEFAELLPPEGVPPEVHALHLRQEAERLDLPISNFAFGADFLIGSGGDTAAEVKRVKGMIDLAEILGVARVRHDCTAGLEARSFENVLPVLADACREVTQYAAGKGIQTMVENHGFFCQDSARVERLAAAVDHPNFSLLVDMGNFLCADEDPVLAVSRTAPLAGYAHAKDFHWKSGGGPAPGEPFFMTRGGNWLRGAVIGHGCVPVRQCVSALLRAGYRDTIAVEFEGIEDNFEALRMGLANLRKYIAEAETACI